MFSLFLILACAGRGDDSGNDSGAYDGTGGEPQGGCVELSREAVADSSVAAGSLDFAADEALAVAAGSFQGTGTLRHADGSEQTVPLQWTVLAGDALTMVDMEPDDSWGGSDTGPAPGADVESCPDYYVVDATGTLTTTAELGSGLWLYESWAAELMLWAADSAGVGFDLDATDLGGDFAPDFDPADWDSAVLSVWASASPEGWLGELQWSASKELGDDMGKGIVGPAGSFDVSRVD